MGASPLTLFSEAIERTAGALQFAFSQDAATQRLDLTESGISRSFLALIISGLFTAVLYYTFWQVAPSAETAIENPLLELDHLPFVALNTLGYFLAYGIGLGILVGFARRFGQHDRIPLIITATNWSEVSLQICFFLVIAGWALSNNLMTPQFLSVPGFAFIIAMRWRLVARFFNRDGLTTVLILLFVLVAQVTLPSLFKLAVLGLT
ncbi:MAG: hypothetical protein AAFR21_11090 [Pseudomonadota bacterium]